MLMEHTAVSIITKCNHSAAVLLLLCRWRLLLLRRLMLLLRLRLLLRLLLLGYSRRRRRLGHLLRFHEDHTEDEAVGHAQLADVLCKSKGDDCLHEQATQNLETDIGSNCSRSVTT